MDKSFDLICYNFQQKIIDIFNEQENIPFQLKYFLFKEIWKIIKEAKIKKDYEIQMLIGEQEKEISTEVSIPDDFLQNTQKEVKQQ